VANVPNRSAIRSFPFGSGPGHADTETVGDEQRLDDETIGDAAARLLGEHADAVVAAMSNFTGLYCDMPETVPVDGHEVVRRGRFYDLVEPADKNVVFDAWRRVRQHGAGTARVTVRDGGPATMYFLDAQATFGVILAILVPGEPPEVDFGGTFSPDAPARSRFGRFRRDDLGRFTELDAAAEQLLRCAPGELRNQDAVPWIHPDHVELAYEHWIEVISSPGVARRWRGRHLCGDGSFLWVELTHTNLLDDPEHGYVASEIMDISDEMAANERAREREELLLRLTESMPLGLVQSDAAGGIVYTNARLHQILGTGDAPTMLGLFATAATEDRRRLAGALDRVLSTGSDVDLDVHIERNDQGRQRICQLTMRGLRDAEGAIAGTVVTVEDVTEATLLRRELEQRATIDELTACHNRAATMAELERVIPRTGPGLGTGVVYVDLDQFKPINDRLGHAAGDEVLVAAAGRLRRAVRDGDVVGRVGGDEFLIVCPGTTGREAVEEVAGRVARQLSGTLVLSGGAEVDLHASVGLAWTGNDGTSADDLVARADTAMYQAKHVRRADRADTSR
jgi:diguanylate cyclase (GGDEF)-like protein/PAS domain S-box-containing protein